jgi:hypothetical protein
MQSVSISAYNSTVSAGFMEYSFPEPDYIRNLLIYLDEGYKEVEKYRR